MAIKAINFPAECWRRPATSKPELVTLGEDKLLAFDAAAAETCYSPRFFLDGYADGTLNVKLFGGFANETGSEKFARMHVSVEAIAGGTGATGDDHDVANAGGEYFDSVNSKDVETRTDGQGYPVEESWALTNKDSAADGDCVRLKLTRDATNDDAGNDFLVSAVVLYES